MAHLDLTPLLRKKFANYPRTLGRYNSSELYGIKNGYVTPRTWINPKEKDVASMLRMWNGSLVHDHIQRLLPTEDNEVKVLHHHYLTPETPIILVAKVDHLPKQENAVWEFKTSEEEYETASDSHNYQAKLYCTIFKRPITRIYQPVTTDTGLFLKELGVVIRDDVWFQEQMKILETFHREVIAAWDEEVKKDINSSI